MADIDVESAPERRRLERSVKLEPQGIVVVQVDRLRQRGRKVTVVVDFCPEEVTGIFITSAASAAMLGLTVRAP